MVKNATGGNKSKGQARKFISAGGSKTSSKLRISEDVLEIYGQATKMCGGGMFDVDCIDGKTRLCIIRGKFRGRGKKDNMVRVGTWVLVDSRDWETGEKLKCDLLEVYSDQDKERLKKEEKHIDWRKFVTNDAVNSNVISDDCDVEFTNQDHEEYKQVMEGMIDSKAISFLVNDDQGEEVDIDDI